MPDDDNILEDKLLQDSDNKNPAQGCHIEPKTG